MADNPPVWSAAMLARLKGLFGVIRLTPFDDSTVEGRARERYRRIALTSIATAGAQALTMLTGLISVPLTLGYLGTERYGLWVTVSSLIALIGFADLGLGNGLLNAVSDAHGRNDRRAAVAAVSNAAFMLAGVGVLIAAAFALCYQWIPWSRLFNVTSAVATAESGPVVAIFTGSFVLNLLLGTIQRVQLGYQQGFIASIWTGIGSLLGLVGLLLAIRLQAGLPWLAVALLGGPIIAAFLNGVAFFGFQYPWLRPRLDQMNFPAALRILRVGSLFFVLQIAGALAYQSDSLIVAQILGAEQVSQYAVPMRLFLLVPAVLGYVVVPLWPAYTESIARHDLGWVRQTLRRSIGLSLLASLPLTALLVVFGEWIVQRWAGSAITPSPLLLLALGIWTIMSSVGGALAMFLNGAGVVKFQVVCAILMVLGNFVLSVILTKRIGTSGVVWGSVIAQAIFILLPTGIFIPRLLRQMDNTAAPAP